MRERVSKRERAVCRNLDIMCFNLPFFSLKEESSFVRTYSHLLKIVNIKPSYSILWQLRENSMLLRGHEVIRVCLRAHVSLSVYFYALPGELLSSPAPTF